MKFTIKIALYKHQKSIINYLKDHITGDLVPTNLEMYRFKFVAIDEESNIVGFVAGTGNNNNYYLVTCLGKTLRIVQELVDKLADEISEEINEVVLLRTELKEKEQYLYKEMYEDCYFVKENGSLKRIYRIIEPKSKK